MEEDAHHSEGDKDKHFHTTDPDTDSDSSRGRQQRQQKPHKSQAQGKGARGGRRIDFRTSIDAETPGVVEVAMSEQEADRREAEGSAGGGSASSKGNPWGEESTDNNTSAFNIDRTLNSDISNSMDDAVEVSARLSSPGSVRARVVRTPQSKGKDKSLSILDVVVDTPLSPTGSDAQESPVSPTLMAQRLAPPVCTTVESLPSRTATSQAPTKMAPSELSQFNDDDIAKLELAFAHLERLRTNGLAEQTSGDGACSIGDEDMAVLKAAFAHLGRLTGSKTPGGGLGTVAEGENTLAPQEEEKGAVAELRQELEKAKAALETQAEEHRVVLERAEKRLQQEKLESDMAQRRFFRQEVDLMALRKVRDILCDLQFYVMTCNCLETIDIFSWMLVIVLFR